MLLASRGSEQQCRCYRDDRTIIGEIVGLTPRVWPVGLGVFRPWDRLGDFDREGGVGGGGVVFHFVKIQVTVDIVGHRVDIVGEL